MRFIGVFAVGICRAENNPNQVDISRGFNKVRGLFTQRTNKV